MDSTHIPFLGGWRSGPQGLDGFQIGDRWRQHPLVGTSCGGAAIPGSLDDHNQGMLSLGDFTRGLVAGSA
jgi:hypothetical protein